MTDARRAYYNENDAFCAQWLRNLIAAGHIAPGDVDERSIEDVRPSDLRGYTQCHFFAGIGLWSLALRLAGWPDDRPCWTGSCPCQPFSAAGKGAGFADERHLWPAWFHLIREQRPVVVFGEQVEAAIAHGWLDLVFDDLEAAHYACGAICLPAAGVGAPNIRHRIYYVADAGGERLDRWPHSTRCAQQGETKRTEGLRDTSSRGELVELASTHRDGCTAHAGPELHNEEHHAEPRGELGDANGFDAREHSEALQARQSQSCGTSIVGNAECARLQERDSLGGIRAEQARAEQGEASLRASFWSDADWIQCRDGKARPVEPGTFPLAHGSPSRVGRLRAYGNAINPQVAAEFIRAHIGS